MQKTTLIGNLGNDPEVRYTQNEIPVAIFSVATTKHWKDSDGNKQEHTEWHRVVAWRGLAETCGNFLKKGSRVYIEGENRTRKWEDQDGNTRYTTEIIAKELEMLSGGNGAESPRGDMAEPPAPDADDVPF